MMYPLLARSVRAQGRARRRLLLRPRPGSGEDVIPPETEVEAESGVGRGGDLLPRLEPEVGRGRASCCAQGRTRWLIVTCCQSLAGWLTR